uniref:Uncharacterized protein n=1 Tax=Cannabis sativa TaxID=3483 RepID=A0A803PL10_CANSA
MPTPSRRRCLCEEAWPESPNIANIPLPKPLYLPQVIVSFPPSDLDFDIMAIKARKSKMPQNPSVTFEAELRLEEDAPRVHAHGPQLHAGWSPIIGCRRMVAAYPWSGFSGLAGPLSSPLVPPCSQSLEGVVVGVLTFVDMDSLEDLLYSPSVPVCRGKNRNAPVEVTSEPQHEAPKKKKGTNRKKAT